MSLTVGTHTITHVEQGSDWQDSFNNWNTSYFVAFEGVDGTYELARRQGKPAPTIGESIDVESWQQKGDYPPKIKVAYNKAGGNKGSGKSGGSQGQRSGGGRGGSMTPEREAAIVRQHSQEMALRYFTARPDLKLRLNGELREVIDWFDEDVRRVNADPVQQAVAEALDGPTLKDARNALAARAQEQNIPLPIVAKAIQNVTQHDALEESDILKIDAILAEAANIMAGDKDDIPF